MIEFLTQKQKKLWGIKGLCEEVHKNLGVLTGAIDGKYSQTDI